MLHNPENSHSKATLNADFKTFAYTITYTDENGNEKTITY